MAFLAKERTDSQYTVTLVDDTGAAIQKSAVTSLKVTLINLDDDAQTVINSRNAQEQTPNFTLGLTMHETSGLVTFNMSPADNQIIGTNRYERHRLIFDVTANSKRLVVQEEILVANVETVTT